MFTHKQGTKSFPLHPALHNQRSHSQSIHSPHGKQAEIYLNFFNLQNTPASTIASILIQELTAQKVAILHDGSTDPLFFDLIHKKYGKELNETFDIDTDVLQVLYRQIIILLKTSGIIQSTAGFYSLHNPHLPSAQDANTFLFELYWNKTNWLTFFPSMPSVAGHLYANRKVIAQLLTKSKKEYYLDSIAIDYLIETNFKYRNELIFTSFFDFAIISWLSILGLSTYTLQTTNGRIKFSLTPKGTAILTNFLKK